MKIVDTKKLLQAARVGQYAVPAINADNVDSLLGIFNSCSQWNAPVIIQLSPIQVYSRKIDYQTMVNVIKTVGANYPVTAAIHLDHGTKVEDVKKAVISGFTSVMYDGSACDYQTNIKNTQVLRTFCKELSLEGELGVIGGEEGSSAKEGTKEIYTNVKEAIEYVKKTNVDFLAVAIGNAHGVYRESPKLNFQRLKELMEALTIPLVLHGASGLSETDLSHAIKLGVSKINFFTEIDHAFLNGIQEKLKQNPNDYTFQCMPQGTKYVKERMDRIIHICGCEGKA
ncbi:MAG: class II fructose-bisphosphate aldolase [Lachnospiraceae bacterium]